jgi:hypothetical protein
MAVITGAGAASREGYSGSTIGIKLEAARARAPHPWTVKVRREAVDQSPRPFRCAAADAAIAVPPLGAASLGREPAQVISTRDAREALGGCRGCWSVNEHGVLPMLRGGRDELNVFSGT